MLAVPSTADAPLQPHTRSDLTTVRASAAQCGATTAELGDFTRARNCDSEALGPAVTPTVCDEVCTESGYALCSFYNGTRFDGNCYGWTEAAPRGCADGAGYIPSGDHLRWSTCVASSGSPGVDEEALPATPSTTGACTKRCTCEASGKSAQRPVSAIITGTPVRLTGSVRSGIGALVLKMVWTAHGCLWPQCARTKDMPQRCKARHVPPLSAQICAPWWATSAARPRAPVATWRAGRRVCLLPTASTPVGLVRITPQRCVRLNASLCTCSVQALCFWACGRFASRTAVASPVTSVSQCKLPRMHLPVSKDAPRTAMTWTRCTSGHTEAPHSCRVRHRGNRRLPDRRDMRSALCARRHRHAGRARRL